jgi:uncharacterized peroxidase-related enzyme
MNSMPVNLIPKLSTEETNEKVEEIFSDILRMTESPHVINMWRTLANSVPVLTGTWQLFSQVFFQSNLPMSLKSMIMFSVSASNHCTYCGAFLEVICRTVGVEGDTLQAIVNDLGGLNPERIQVIIRFAQKVARSPFAVTEEEFDMIRSYGITDEEILEIISIAAMGNYFDTIADSLKLQTDELFTSALPGGQLITNEGR